MCWTMERISLRQISGSTPSALLDHGAVEQRQFPAVRDQPAQPRAGVVIEDVGVHARVVEAWVRPVPELVTQPRSALFWDGAQVVPALGPLIVPGLRAAGKQLPDRLWARVKPDDLAHRGMNPSTCQSGQGESRASTTPRPR